MRGEGQTFYPDFHAEKGEDGGIRLRVSLKGDRTDVVAKDYREAIKKCAPILKDAGITLPSQDLPMPPGRPDKDELPKLRKNIKPDDGLPSLTTSA
jgi:hypothetical protein